LSRVQRTEAEELVEYFLDETLALDHASWGWILPATMRSNNNCRDLSRMPSFC